MFVLFHAIASVVTPTTWVVIGQMSSIEIELIN